MRTVDARNDAKSPRVEIKYHKGRLRMKQSQKREKERSKIQELINQERNDPYVRVGF